MGNTKKNPFLAQKIAPQLCTPGRRSDVSSIMQVQTYLGGLIKAEGTLPWGGVQPIDWLGANLNPFPSLRTPPPSPIELHELTKA